MTRPFEGVKILDFTQVLAGPYASYQLALLGADVIKIESREGDDMRYGNRANEWEKRGLYDGAEQLKGSVKAEIDPSVSGRAAGAVALVIIGRAPPRWSRQ